MSSAPPIIQTPHPSFRTIELPEVTREECDALLSGLRLLQWHLNANPSPDSLPDAIHDILLNNGSELTLDEIDELCHRLNCE